MRKKRILIFAAATALAITACSNSTYSNKKNPDRAIVGTHLTQVTSLTSGNQYVIVGNNNGYALPSSPTVSSGKVAGTALASVPNNGAGFLWTITATGNFWYINDGTKNIYHTNGGASGTNLSYGSNTTYKWKLEYSTSGQNHWTFTGVDGTTINSRGMLCNGSSFGGYALSNESTYKYMNIYEVVSSGDTPTLDSISISGSMSKTTYTTAENWDPSGLIVTGTYSDSNTDDLTDSVAFSYYSNEAMTISADSPSDLGTGNKTVYIKATVSDISNSTGYGQSVTISEPTYTVTYDPNGATSGTVPSDANAYTAGQTVTVLGNTGSLAKTDYLWSGWNTANNGTGMSYASGGSFEINSNVTLYAQWERELGDLTNQTGTINFGSADGSLNVNAVQVSGEDNIGVTWTVTTVPGSSGQSFTPNASYAQIGASAKPASTITFESQNLQNDYKVTAFSAKFGGFSGTTGTITLKVDNSSVGTGSLNAANDVTVSKSSTAVGSKLSVSVTGIDKGVKVYYISYTLAPVVEEQTITASSDSVRCNETITLTTNADSATWTITSNTADASLSTDSGKTTIVSATQAGSVTVQASASGYSTVSKSLTFLEGTYYDVTFDSNGGSESPATKVVADGATFVFPSAGTREHYSFDGWTSTGSAPYFAAGATSPAVTDNIEYVAHWTEDEKYTVTYNANSNGTGSYSDSNHYAGSYTLLPFENLSGVVANSGYQFKDYTVGGVHKNPGDTIEIDGSVEVVVNFEETRYTVVFGTAAGTTGISDFSNTSFVIPSGVTLDNIQGKVYCNTTNQSQALRLGSGDTLGSFDASIDNNYFIKKVIVGMKYFSSDTTAKLAVTPNGGETVEKTMTNSFADYEFDVSSACANKVTIGNTIVGKRVFVSGLTIVYGEKTTEQKIATNIQTMSALKFTYNDEVADFDIKNAAIRFGGFVSEDLWSELNNVEGFGVVIANTSSLGEDSIKEKFDAKKAVFAADEDAENDNVDAILTGLCTDLSAKKASANRSTPVAADTDQKAFMGVDPSDNYYIWTSRKDIDEADYATQFTAVAYVKIDGDILFLQETTTSIKELAVDRLASMDSSNPAYGAIEYITEHY